MNPSVPATHVRHQHGPHDPADQQRWAIELSGVVKKFTALRGSRLALDGLDLHVPMSGVHGFLGRNGSGKSTTIRALVGLTRIDSGSMRIFGRPVPEQLPEVIEQVGAIVERPRFVPEFSARRNLLLLATASGTPRHRVEQVLAETGLAERADDRCKTYSLGMKQRLAISATLLKDPQLLIFDEPTNGLDPEGIADVRAMVRRLGRSGRAVLVSSHLLAEIEQVADTVSVINAGRLVAEGPLSSLLSGDTTVEVVVAEPFLAADVLRGGGWQVEHDSDRLLVSGSGRPEQISQLLAEHRLYPSHLGRTRAGLEDAYLRLTGAAPDHRGGQVA